MREFDIPSVVETSRAAQDGEDEDVTGRRSPSLWFQEERDSMYSVNPLREGGTILVGESDVKLEKAPEKEEDKEEAIATTLSAELVKEGIRIIQQGLFASEYSMPTLFDVLQTVGASIHKRIIAQQKAAADAILAEETWGEQIRAIKHAEVTSGMRQQVPLSKAGVLLDACSAAGFGASVDTKVLPGLLCAIAGEMRDKFKGALLVVAENASQGAVKCAEDPNEVEGKATSPTIELKVGPIKRVNRIAVKVEEYRAEKGEDKWPHSQFLTDVLRASFIVSTAEEMVRVWESVLSSSEFEVVRLKNKIGRCKEPYNLHVNLLFKPEECEDPILCELQFYPRKVFDLQHCQHQAYEVSRATGVEQLL
jgi:hypothetical protein